MRHACYTLYIIIATFVLLGCRGRSEFRQTLESLDSVLVQSPDSVYNILVADEAEAGRQSESDRMYYELLRADAQNKAYIDFTTDSVMKIVADYYDHNGNANEQMRAHYLLGCTYRDLQDVPMELQCFQEAVEKADTTKTDCDWGRLSSIYGQMANIYHSQYLPQEELKVLGISEQIAEKTFNQYSATKAYELRLRAYNILNMPDSVLSISKRARERYISYGDTIEATRLLAPAISILIDQERYDEAYEYMILFEKAPFYKDSLGHINKKYAIHLHDKGRYDLHKNNIAEAKESFYKLIGYGYEEAAYSGLLSLYEKTKQSDSISKYANLFALANDSSYIGKNSEVIARMTAMYNYGRQEKIAKEKTIENAKAKAAIFLISAIAIVIFFILIATIAILRRRSIERERIHREQEKLLLKRYNETKETISKLEMEKENLIAENANIDQLLHTINKFENEKLELETKLQEFNHITDDVDFKAWYEDFINCNAVNKLHAKTIISPNSVIKIEEDLWEELSIRIKTNCPAFFTILDVYAQNQTYQKIVILNTFDFTNGEISILLSKTSQQISNIHNRISKRIFPSSSETRKLKQNLQEILRNKRIKNS